MAQSDGGSVAALARACIAAVLSKPMLVDASDMLESAFPEACSFRVALPLGTVAGGGSVIVSSDLRRPHRATTFWATTGEASLAGRSLKEGRTAVADGPGILDCADLRQLQASEGATSFLCAPVLLEAPALLAPEEGQRPAAAVLLVCYPSTAAAPQEELQLALLLAGRLSLYHSEELDGYAERLRCAIHPTEHTAWGPGVDAQYPELGNLHSGSSDSDTDDDGEAQESSSSGGDGSGGAIGGGGRGNGRHSAARALRRAVRRTRGGGGRGGSGSRGCAPNAALDASAWAFSSWTLQFEDGHQLERRFRHWRNTRLAKVDVTALLALLLYYTVSGFLPTSSGCRPAWLLASLPPALTVLLSLLLLMYGRSNRWYSRHRDQLLVCTFLLLSCHHTLDLSSQLLAAPSEGAWRAALLRVDYGWCLALAVTLQVQFVGQCLMLLARLALKEVIAQPGCAAAAWLPSTPAQHGPSDAAISAAAAASMAGHCSLLNGAAWALLVKLVLPCCLAYWTELAARRTFCRRVAAAAAAQGAR